MDSHTDDSDDYQEDSDAYSPEPKLKPAKAKAPMKKAAAKPAAKKTLQSKMTGPKAVSNKRARPASDSEEDVSALSNTPPAKKQKKASASKKSAGKPLAEIENDRMMIDDDDAPAPTNKKTSTETYQKLTQLEHIIKRPDTYIGSVERMEQKMWVFNKDTKLVENRSVSYVPGLFKIFDEILVNAADNKQRDPSMTYLKVVIDREAGEISVENNGKAIPVEMHEKENVYIPELVFGHLLAGSNFDDNEKKTVGGRNGYGAKLCNVFSKTFTLEVQDSSNGKRYRQTWTDNMSRMEKAKITSNKTSDFVRVTFKPDFGRFGMSNGIDDDLEALLYRRVYDMAGTVEKCKVHLNGEHLKLDWKSYCELYARAIARERDDPVEEAEKPAAATVLFEDRKAHARWQIGFTVSDGSFQQVSFVNNIATTTGGTHVNYIADQICGALLTELNKRKKGHSLKTNHARNHIFIFINCFITNPSFNSQTKEQMTTKVSAFGSKCELTDGFLKKIKTTEAIANIMHFAEQKADKMMAKSDGNKRSRISNEKLVDANYAGTKHSSECTLILTEGDSAKGLAIAGRAVLDPDRIGVFPLRGKMLNVRDASIDAILKNKEIQNIKQFLGLKHKQVYTDTRGLRYGHLMIMADQDHDGSHIKGLLINFLEVQYPSLLRIPGFFREFITPVVKVWQGSNPKKPQRLHSFFTMPQYEEWKLLHQLELRRWSFKYLKGLGTSSAEDAQVYFTNLDDHLKGFSVMKQEESELFDLAFSKKKADARKEWLGKFVPGTYLDHSTDLIKYEDFVNKELILFSMADNMRSIPSMIDGLKPGQRKVIYGCFKRNLTKDKKVVELAGYVSENTAYHHGEMSLQQTIIGLAQDYVGSNNINCLEPSGNFGSRLAGGTDAASARYIFTRLSPFARKVFNPLDDPNLEYQFEDGKMIEPKVFVPVIPMVLANGADGIGTGWSTSIPNYHPIDLVKNLRRRMGRLDPEDAEEKPFEPMVPWFRGWKGTAEPEGNGRFKFNGIAARDELNANEVVITELPIRVWTDDFKARLEEVIRAEKAPSFIKDYKEFNDHRNVRFIIQLEEKYAESVFREGLLEKFKLNKSIGTTNIVAFNSQGQIQKYNSPEEIMEEFYKYRMEMYAERKSYWLKLLEADHRKLQNQYRFVKEIIEGDLVVYRKKKTVIVNELRERGYDAFPPKSENRKVKSTDEELDHEDEQQQEEGDDDGAVDSAKDFDYLLSMPIYSLTAERLDKLTGQIEAKKAEFDELDALSEKDLWCRDLDQFEETWENQMQLDEEIAKNILRKGRRASKKIGAGKGKARAAKDDDDYDPGSKKGAGRSKAVSKAAAAKPAPSSKKQPPKGEETQKRFTEKFTAKVQAKPKPVGGYGGVNEALSDDDIMAVGKFTASAEPTVTSGRTKRAATTKSKYVIDDDESDDDDEEDFLEVLEEPAAKPNLDLHRAKDEDEDEDMMDADDDEDVDDVAPAKHAPGAPATQAKPEIVISDESEGDLVAPPKKDATSTKPAAKASAAAAKTKAKATPTYADFDMESDSDDDHLLGDVGDLVKGIGATGSGSNANGGRFSLHMSHSTSSHGAAAIPKLKSKVSKSNFDAGSEDDTNYEALAMSSPRKSTMADDVDDSFSDDAPVTKTAAKSKMTAASNTATAPSKKRGRTVACKIQSKSEAGSAPVRAKAKAAPKAKAAQAETDLSPAAKAYAKRRARTTLDDDDDDDDHHHHHHHHHHNNDDDYHVATESPPVAAPAPRGRPARAAASKAKPIIIEEDSDDDDGAVDELEEESDDFDESG